MAASPWASGPKEILRHGLRLLQFPSDTNRRLAMLAIDNSVELMIKTFLGLPGRITGLRIKRREYEEVHQSFPKLLNALEEHAPDRLAGVSLAEIEWYHRLRNQLYHEGNGLTVDLEKAQVYEALAEVLFRNLFGEDADKDGSDWPMHEPSSLRSAEAVATSQAVLRDYLVPWAEWDWLLSGIRSAVHPGVTKPSLLDPDELVHVGHVGSMLAQRIRSLRSQRRRIVYEPTGAMDALTRSDVDELNAVIEELRGLHGRIVEGSPFSSADY